MPNVLDCVSIVRRIIKRYRGSNTCNGHAQQGNVKTQTNIGISSVSDSRKSLGIDALEKIQEKSSSFMLFELF